MILTSGMAWTQADADAVQQAIRDLATGKRVVMVTYAGPPQRSVEYASTDLQALRELHGEINRALGNAPTRRLASFSSGFRARRGDNG